MTGSGDLPLVVGTERVKTKAGSDAGATPGLAVAGLSTPHRSR